MQELEDRIRHDGIVKAGNVLKVDAFLNHQCDVELFDHMGAEWARLFEGVEINKILTIEASGIGMACIAAQHFGGVPVVFAKKAQSINLDGEQYATTIYSFTKQKEYPVIVGKRFLSEGDKVLIIDDFLANGCALEGLIKICEAAGARYLVLALRWRRASKAVAISSASAASALRAWPVSRYGLRERRDHLRLGSQHKRLVCDVTKGLSLCHIFCMRGGVDMDENKMGWSEYAAMPRCRSRSWHAIAKCRCFARRVRADRA